MSQYLNWENEMMNVLWWLRTYV